MPTSWLRPACAISRIRAASSSTLCACSTMRSPTGVTRDLALAALEQPRAELLLELLDRHRQRRLADEALLRRAAEAALLRDRDEVAQLVQRHRLAAASAAVAQEARRSPRPVSGCLSPKSTVASR